MKSKIKQLIKKNILYLIPEILLKLLLASEPSNFKNKNIYFWKFIGIKKKYGSRIEDFFKKKPFKIGIVVQGPIIKDENYTYETLLFLKNYAKKSDIILSTWVDEDEKELKKIEKLGIKIIRNNKPIQGIENLNLQICSTKNGVEYFLSKKEINYIMKLRTDQRINLENFENKFVSLLEQFPVDKNCKLQKKRIIGIDINTAKYIPFSFCDVFQFGSKEDMNLMWNVELSLEKRSFQERKSKNPEIKNMFNYVDPEIYLYKNFLKKTNFTTENTLESSLKSLKERFLILDSEMISLHWFKYSLSKKIGDHNSKKCHEVVKFLDWLELYMDFNHIDLKKLKSIEKIVFDEKYF